MGRRVGYLHDGISEHLFVRVNRTSYSVAAAHRHTAAEHLKKHPGTSAVGRIFGQERSYIITHCVEAVGLDVTARTQKLGIDCEDKIYVNGAKFERTFTKLLE